FRCTRAQWVVSTFTPPFLDEVVLKRLRVGPGIVDIALRRSRSQVVVDVLERKGGVKVLTTH
ncbi:hypothetical protein CN166_03595, partial [Sinorhizobium medicae]